MKTLFITIRELYLHPRNVVDGFLSHKKSPFTHPFKLLIAVSLSTTALLLASGTLFWNVPDVSTAVGESEAIVQIQMWTETVSRDIITTYLPISAGLLLIPAVAVSGLIFLRNELQGFYRNLILSTYAVAVANLFSLLWIPILLIDPDLIANSSGRVSIAIAMLGVPILWIYQKYFDQKAPISIIRQLSTAASGFVLYIVLSGFASGILGYMLFAVRRIAELSGQG